MADVKVGMRLRSKFEGGILSVITVIGLTKTGFTYSLDGEYDLIPRWGMRLKKDGHTHYGLNGEALYEPLAERDTLPKHLSDVGQAKEK